MTDAELPLPDLRGDRSSARWRSGGTIAWLALTVGVLSGLTFAATIGTVIFIAHFTPGGMERMSTPDADGMIGRVSIWSLLGLLVGLGLGIVRRRTWQGKAALFAPLVTLGFAFVLFCLSTLLSMRHG